MIEKESSRSFLFSPFNELGKQEIDWWAIISTSLIILWRGK